MYLRTVAVVIAASAFVGLFGFVSNRHSLATPHMAGAVGDLDQTFGQSGKVTAVFFAKSAFAYAAALQSDGKIIAAGGNSTTQGFSLARFNTDGTLDNSFGQVGKVATAFSGLAFAQAVAVQADGKIVAAGVATNSGTREFALVRYLPDGQIDSAFGSGGKVATNFSGAGGDAHAIVIQPDGRILAAGSANEDFALSRYNSDGTLDNSFGISGKFTLDFEGFPDSAQALALQADGKILVAGAIIRALPSPIGLRQRFGIIRCNADGTLDSSFGSSGKVNTSFNNNEFLDNEAFAIALQPDGRFVVGGWTTGSPGVDFALARYNADGSLDPTFGSSGRVTTDFSNMGNDRIAALALQPDGKIIAAGFTDLRISHDLFALTRYNSNGTLDSSFGAGGKVTTQFFAGGFDALATAVLLQPDGNIVAIGYAFFTGGNHMALARYIGDAALPTPSPTPSPSPTPTPTPSPSPMPPLRLFLTASPPVPNQVAAIDSVLFLPDPFEVFSQTSVLRVAIDPNTRATVFVQGLQLLPGEVPSSVIVRLANTLEAHEIPAEGVRLVGNADFAQVTFRLPDQLWAGDWTITVKAHGQETNSGIIRIR